MKEGLLILNTPSTLVKPSAKGSVVFAIKVNESSENNDSQTVSIQLIDTATRSVAVSKKIGINKTWNELRFKVTTGKTYNLTIENPNWIRLSIPASQWLAFANIPTYAVLGKLWVYNEKAPYFYFSNTGKEPLIFKDVKGEALPVEPLSKDNLFRIALRPAAWYSVENTEYKALQFFDSRVLFFPYLNMDTN